MHKKHLILWIRRYTNGDSNSRFSDARWTLHTNLGTIALTRRPRRLGGAIYATATCTWKKRSILTTRLFVFSVVIVAPRWWVALLPSLSRLSSRSPRVLIRVQWCTLTSVPSKAPSRLRATRKGPDRGQVTVLSSRSFSSGACGPVAPGPCREQWTRGNVVTDALRQFQ